MAPVPAQNLGRDAYRLPARRDRRKLRYRPPERFWLQRSLASRLYAGRGLWRRRHLSALAPDSRGDFPCREPRSKTVRLKLPKGPPKPPLGNEVESTAVAAPHRHGREAETPGNPFKLSITRPVPGHDPGNQLRLIDHAKDRKSV